MIRVLQIGLGPNPGGVENCIMNYFRHVQRKEFMFDFVDIYGQGLAFEVEILKLGGKVIKLPNLKRHPIKGARLLEKYLKENEYSIIHINLLSAANLIPVFTACKNKEAKVIVHSHNASIPSGIMRKMMNAVNMGKLRRLPVYKWACGEKAGKWMWGEEFSNDNVIHNAIDVCRFTKNDNVRKEMRKKCSFSDDDIVVGFVGRLSEQKNVLFLPEILLELVKKTSAYKLLIVGDGVLRERLKTRLEEYGLLKKVYFTGVTEKTADWYQAMDAFVLPSLFEGLPVVGIEAQAMHLPCFISNRVTKEIGITDYVHYLSLEEGSQLWANLIHSAIFDRITELQEFPKEYQIAYAAKRLECRYKEIVNAGE